MASEEKTRRREPSKTSIRFGAKEYGVTFTYKRP